MDVLVSNLFKGNRTDTRSLVVERSIADEEQTGHLVAESRANGAETRAETAESRLPGLGGGTSTVAADMNSESARRLCTHSHGLPDSVAQCRPATKHRAG